MKRLLLFVTLSFLVLNGYPQWSPDPGENTPVALAPGEEAIPKVATTNNGITYIAWFSNESGNYNVRLQKLDLYGTILWEEEGLLVSDNPSMTWLTDWDMTVDLEGGAILAFQDIRNGDNDVFVYRISSDGAFIWGENGIELSTGPAFDASPKVCVTASNNTIVAWQADEVIILQKISPGGDKLWGDAGITLSGSNTFSWPQVLPVGTDDVFLKYFEDSGPVWAPTRHVFAQRYDPDGNTVWADPTVVSNAGGISAWTQVFPLIPDGNDGFYIAWHDDRDADNHSSVFVQHVASDGATLLGDDGTEASLQPGRQNFYPYLALPDNSTDIFVYWNEMDSDQNNRGIYGQKISESGDRQWTDNGKPFIEISSTNVYPFSASSAGENTIVFYEHYWNGVDAGIRAMMIDPEGMFVWSQQMTELCSVQSEKVHAVAGKYFSGQWISAWEDDRNGNRDIYAQNIQLDGSLGPVSAGEVEVHPDTLFFEENPQTLQVAVLNNTLEPYTITEITEGGTYYIVTPYPSLPYSIPSGDSLIFDVYFEFITSDQSNAYVYENLYVVASAETDTVVVAINEDLLTGTGQNGFLNEDISVYPNPSNASVTFERNAKPTGQSELIIRNIEGQIIRHWEDVPSNKITWDGTDMNNRAVRPGIFIYTWLTAHTLRSGKITIRASSR